MTIINTHGLLQISIIGGLLAGIFAFLRVWKLMRWFKKREVNALHTFAYYFWIVGALVVIYSIQIDYVLAINPRKVKLF